MLCSFSTQLGSEDLNAINALETDWERRFWPSPARGTSNPPRSAVISWLRSRPWRGNWACLWWR